MSLQSLLDAFTIHPSRSFLLLYLPIGFTLILTLFSAQNFKKQYNDFKAYIYYFLFFSLCFVIVPAFILVFYEVDLATMGLTLGNTSIGLKILLIGIPLSVLSAFIGSHDPEMKAQYPFSKRACKNGKSFVLYEFAYLVFYYFAWEFLFRGILLFLFFINGDVISALVIQTIISTVYHKTDHPKSEIFGAFIGGFIFGWIAIISGSFIYCFILHAILGICNDSLLYFRYHRKKGEST